MKLEKLEERIIAWFEGNLEMEEEQKLFKEVGQSTEAKALFEVYKKLYQEFEEEEMVMPSASFKEKTKAALLSKNTEEIATTSHKKIRKLNFQILKYAAAVLLLVSVGILIGLNISKNNQVEDISMELMALKKDMKNLLQNESTVQRIRAVKMSNDFQEVDDELLKVLIKTMNSDKSENVRSAAIDALANFSHEKMVKQAFLKTLETQTEDIIQIKLIRVLAKEKEKNALPYLDKILENKKASRYLKTEATEGKKTIINI